LRRAERRGLPGREGYRRLVPGNQVRALGRDVVHWATSGGEDYELLLTCAPEAFERLAGGLGRAMGTTLTAIGEMMPAAERIRYLDACGEPVSVGQGFEHFVTGRAGA
jgi:thiamine-monophosphate kinase